MARSVIIKERCAAHPEICSPITACPLHGICDPDLADDLPDDDEDRFCQFKFD